MSKKALIVLIVGIIMICLFLVSWLVFKNIKTSDWVALVVGGAAVGCININTLPLVLALGGREYVGTFTGYYYTATMSASVTGPILCGLVIGLFKEDYNFMFLFCAIMFTLGLAVITQVRHGELSKDEDDTWLKEAVEEAEKD